MTVVRSTLAVRAALVLAIATTPACGWHGLNSMSLPGTQGGGPGAYTIQAQLPDVGTIQQNSRVRVGDVNVGTVTKIQRQGWHALLTLRINGNVKLPANATATIGQTSLLGSLHVELAPPVGIESQGQLHNGSLIPLSAGASYPSTEQTLSAVSLLLNGGGIGQIQEITKAFSTAFSGREKDIRSLVEQLDRYVGYINEQTNDIIAATESLNKLAGKFADQKPVIDAAAKAIPDALAVLRDQRDHLAEAFQKLGQYSALAATAVDRTRESLIKEFNDIGPILGQLASTGPALTRSLSVLATYPWPRETIETWQRGDYANDTFIIDLTLSRVDAALLTGTRFEGSLTGVEMRWGRTIGQLPSPYTAGNPLVIPYHWNQGP
ncbi:mammalian cell entry protein [Mycobacterium triplex]|uniref:Fis family transcriptional regulator n=1 Tax=Mycobacterium triplex TaxID=47839 RepID=A0A024JXL5_9MYCO|nr:MCE family protein [Mycobacterium triplex]ORW99235.1 mammalian cell entry protein [Mycobacterium triplex]CDO88565.1 Fis family transcriptional regulator [Mycobacterium triplex]